MARAPYISLLIIIILSSLLNIFALQKGHSWGDDFALYIAQAKSLVEGTMENLLAQNSFTVSHSTYPFVPNLYPWGFPIILSPLYAMFGLALLPMKVIGIIFFELSVMLLFFMFRSKLDSLLLLFLVSFFAFNPFFLILNDNIGSDIPFFFFSLFSIFIIEKVTIDDIPPKYLFLGYFLVGSLVLISYSIRTVGFTLVPLLFFSQIISFAKTHRINLLKYVIIHKLFFLPYIIFVFSVLIIDFFLPAESDSYLLFLPNINSTSIVHNVLYYVSLPSQLFGPNASLIIYGSTLPFVVVGIIQNLKTDFLYLIYSFLMILVLISYPFLQGPRFILPFFPFYIYFFCIGLKSFASMISLFVKPVILPINYSYILPLIITISLFSYSIQIAYSNSNNINITDSPFTESSREMFNFISQYTDKDDMIAFFKPRILRLLTDRQSIMASNFIHITTNQVDFLVIHKGKGNYDQIDPNGGEYLRVSEKFPIVFVNVDFVIFQLKMPDDAK